MSTREQVKEMRAQGMGVTNIARELGIHKSTASKYAASEFLTATEKRVREVAARVTEKLATARTDEERMPCRIVDPEIWFDDDVRLARMLCQQCPVRNACLQTALERAIPYGVWGGATAEMRARMMERAS